MNRYGKRCVLYPRVSTEMQVDGYSLEGQKNMLTRFADREEMIVVDTYEDAGKSGKSIEGRPAFQKMLRDIEDGLDIDYILVYKLSRFGRNAADILNSLELVQSYGVNLICIEEGIDSSQTSGKLLISVLSAVAEIERENIIEQTMNGRREKARQGGWNGGFAPYGYTLEDNKLMIEETEAVAIRKIFELYTSSEIGLGGIANQLNLQGIRKIPRQNGTLEDWTGHFIKLILDNPVYCGKIAYGRRTKEKVKGTKNDYQMKRNDDYILTEGQHKGIVSEEVWEKAHAKRLRTGVKQPSKIGRDRVHLLSGLLKCPVCGSPMYTNKHAWTNKDGTYKEIYYYVCSRNRMVRGKHCEYKAMLKKTDIEPMVIEAIREIVRNEEYAQAIKKRIGVQIDTKAVDKELEGYQAKLKEVDLNKTRLEREIDSLPADAKYRERKLHDMTLRLDSLYDVIVELEEKIEDARLRRDAIKQQAITLENIYKIMVNFDCVYNIINDEEKRNVVTALIKEIEIYRNDESEYPLKRIGLNFPVFKDGGEVTELLWDKGNTVEARGLFTTNGYFDENDHRYVPGTISFEYTKKVTPVTVDTSYDWSVFEPQLPSDKKDAIRFSQYTDSDCTAQIDLGSVYSGLNDVVVDATVSVYDELTDGDLKDWLGVFKDFDKMDSYLVPGQNGEEFYVTMDVSDPYSYVMLVRDIAGSKFVKLILKEKLDDIQNLNTTWSLVKISSALSTVSTITNVLYKQHSIEKDMDKLREEVLQTSYGTSQQRQEALRQVDALEHDQSAFMLLTTILPLVVAGAPIALGATMSAAPAILFTAMLGVLTSVAPMFWELRTAQIKGQKFRVDFVVDPSGYVYDRETNERLEGVKTTAYYIPEPEDVTEAFWKNTPAANTYGELWNGEEYNQSNPLYTNADGKYAWNVPFGWWRVKYEKEGYETAWSDWMTVPPEQTEVNIGLTPIAPEYTVRAQTVTAEHVSVRVTSDSAAKQTARCVLAAYDTDGRLTATAVQTLSPGSSVVLTLSGLPADGTVKLFILNSTTGEPLRSSFGFRPCMPMQTTVAQTTSHAL